MQHYIYYDPKRDKKKKGRSLSKLLVLCLTVALFAELGIMVKEIMARRERPPAAPVVEVLRSDIQEAIPIAAPLEPELGKKDLAGLIGQRSLKPAEEPVMSISDRDGNLLYVRTTIVPELQALADGWVKNSLAHQAALVVLDPDSGQVLTLAGYNEDGGEGNAALAGSFPAASLFKMVTAAAVVEKGELSADSKLAYDGGRHTLYKKNVLGKAPDEGRQSTTLEESFAYSINSVFGKLGAATLGPEELADFAGRFGFNHEIDFEMPVEASTFSVDDDDSFHLNELASGYNRSTKVSPLHGAMMAASVVADGRLYQPSMVREVFDRENRIRYQAGPPDEAREVISPATAGELARMMRTAVETGTGRKTFGAASGHPVLSRLEIGGKSGTINNEQGQKVDWFVAWAKPRPGSGCRDKLALSAVVVHSGVTNTSSQRLIRDALNAYYRDRLSNEGPEHSSTVAGLNRDPGARP